MTNEIFNEVTAERVRMCIDVMCKKSDEYATDNDKLHNFKVAASLQGCSDIKALGGMMCKHTVSIYDLINDFENGKNIPLDLWNEKIGDSINYLLLLNALVIEHEIKKPKSEGGE
jgi:hypothetical protein